MIGLFLTLVVALYDSNVDHLISIADIVDLTFGDILGDRNMTMVNVVQHIENGEIDQLAVFLAVQKLTCRLSWNLLFTKDMEQYMDLMIIPEYQPYILKQRENIQKRNEEYRKEIEKNWYTPDNTYVGFAFTLLKTSLKALMITVTAYPKDPFGILSIDNKVSCDGKEKYTGQNYFKNIIMKVSEQQKVIPTYPLLSLMLKRYLTLRASISSQ